jgi:hypothetical protein
VAWKVLAGLLLTLPPAAYVAGTLVGPPELPTGDSAVTVPESPATSGGPSGPGPTGPPLGDTAGGPAWEPRPPEVLGTQAQRSSEPPSRRGQRSEAPPEQPEPETAPTPPEGGTTAPPPDDQTSPTPGDPGDGDPDDPTTGAPPEPTGTPTDGGGEGDTEPGA